ncbi:MAG: serine/threonine protein kinase [Myxococcales bacterium]|nr:serine/threonine protein kinase [Myxococcales bacterium]
MNRTILACLLALGLTTTACTHDFGVQVPKGFAAVHDGDRYDFRATDAEGVVIGVREKDNDPQGDLAFWSGAIDAKLRAAGYQAVAQKPTESRDGISGRQLRYRIDRGGRDHAFWVTVFVTQGHVVTVEAGGDLAFFAEKEKAIEASIASVSAS